MRILVFLFMVGCSDNSLVPCSRPLEVAILSPVNGTALAQGTGVQMEAIVTDFCGRDLEESTTQLVSDLDQEIEGEWTWEDNHLFLDSNELLQVGRHAVSLNVISPTGHSGESGIELEIVENLPPTIELVNPPPENHIQSVDEELVISALVFDEEEPLESLQLTWTLNGDPWLEAPQNPLANGSADISPEFAAGCHSVSVTVTDAIGQSAVAEGIVILWGDESDAFQYRWMIDIDGDGWGVGSQEEEIWACEEPEGYAEFNEIQDCDDGNPDVYPGAPDYCDDGVDSDCDPITPSDCYPVGEIDSSAAGIVFDGLPDSYLGTSSAYAGDSNGDGFSDVLIGTHQADSVYLIEGPVSGMQDLSNSSYYSCKMTSDGFESRFGSTMPDAQDINGDGYSDVLIGAEYYAQGANQPAIGSAYLIFGGPNGMCAGNDTIVLDEHLYENALDSTEPSVIRFMGKEHLDYLGSALDFVPDIDGDGLSEIVLGAQGNDDSTFQAGAAYVVYSGDLMGTTPSESLDSLAHLKLVGASQSEKLGFVVSGADIDGDGKSDILLGNPNYSANGQNGGRVQIVFGNSIPIASSVQNVNSIAEMTIIGNDAYDEAGTFLGNAGDLDSDGDDEYFIGTPGEENNAGAVYLMPGFYQAAGTYLLGEDVSSASPNATGAVRFVGAADDRLQGAKVIPDVNEDGNDEIMLSAPEHSQHLYRGGTVYLLYGGANHWGDWWDPSTGASVGTVYPYDASSTGVNTAHFYLQNQGHYFGTSFSSAGDLNGDGSNDILIGSGHYHGEVLVFLGGGT
jgi:hypothetical protein